MNENTKPTKNVIEDPTREDPDEEIAKPDLPDYTVREIEFDFLSVYMYENFLGEVSLGVSKIPDPSKETAYVTFRNNRLIMGWNPQFFASLAADHRRGVIKHELYHIVLDHILTRAPADHRKAQLANIAFDLAINCLIGDKELPDFCLFPGKFPKKCTDVALGKLIESFPPFECAEWYLDRLVEHMQKNGGGNGEGDADYVVDIGNNGMTLDDHSGWGNVPEEIKDIIREQVRQLVEKGVRRVNEKGSWGSVPANMQEYLKRLIANEIDWRSVVKQFHGTARTLQRVSTVKKYNKKAPYQFPGVRRPLTARFLYAIDQSGSMSDDEIVKGFSEVFALSNESEVDVINFDTEVDQDSFKTWKKGKKFEWIRTKGGGTDFNCVANFVNDSKRRGRYSGLIIFSDGYAPTMTDVPGVRVLWLITPNGTMEAVRPGDLVVKMRFDDEKKGI